MAICLSPNKCNKVTILEKRDNIIKFNVFVFKVFQICGHAGSFIDLSVTKIRTFVFYVIFKS